MLSSNNPMFYWFFVMTAPSEVRSVFGVNLRALCGKYPSNVKAANELGINRTQLNRYLASESFPRPDQLLKICEHFGVDARILTHPLTEISSLKNREKRVGLVPSFDSSFRPVPTELFPDGFYNEWSYSHIHKDKIDRYLGMAFTQNSNRFFKIKAPTLLDDNASTKRVGRHWNTFMGQAFMQMNNFAIIDRSATELGPSTIAMTSFVSGFSIDRNIHIGYKLAGSSWDLQRPHSRMPVVLQYVGTRISDAMRTERTPNVRIPSEAPNVVMKALSYIESFDDAHKR